MVALASSLHKVDPPLQTPEIITSVGQKVVEYCGLTKKETKKEN